MFSEFLFSFTLAKCTKNESIYVFHQNLKDTPMDMLKKFCSMRRDQKYQSNILFTLNEQVHALPFILRI